MAQAVTSLVVAVDMQPAVEAVGELVRIVAGVGAGAEETVLGPRGMALRVVQELQN